MEHSERRRVEIVVLVLFHGAGEGVDSEGGQGKSDGYDDIQDTHVRAPSIFEAAAVGVNVGQFTAIMSTVKELSGMRIAAIIG